MRPDPVRLGDPDPGRPASLGAQAVRLAPAMDPRVVLHHVASTAAPGPAAKPFTDILAVAPALAAAEPGMAARGYEAMDAIIIWAPSSSRAADPSAGS